MLAEGAQSGHYALVIASAEEFVALRTSNDPDEYKRAAHESATDDVWLDVIDRFPDMRQWVAHNKTTSHVVLERLARDSDPSVRWQVAMANRVGVDVLRSLANDPDETVRARVASHNHVPADVLESLRNDESRVVSDAAETTMRKRI